MWAVQEKTGWTNDYILWHEPILSIRLKIADTVKYDENYSIESDDLNEVFEIMK